MDSPLEWVSTKDFEDHESWFLNYLGRKNLIPPEYGSKRYLPAKERLTTLSTYLGRIHQTNPDFIELTLKKMKAAWAQRVRRLKSPHDKPYNFFMSKKVQGRLRFLASTKGTNINKALEQLILDETGMIKGLQQKHQAEMKQLKERHQEELKRLKERAPRKNLEQLLRNVSGGPNNNQEADSEQAQSPQTGIMLPTEELEKLVSTMVDRRLSEVGESRTGSLSAHSADEQATDGSHPDEQAPSAPTVGNKQYDDSADTPSETEADTDMEAASRDTRPLSPFAQKVHNVWNEAGNDPDP